MKHNECCLNNFYALELLDNLDMGDPTQKEIHQVEKLLADDDVKPQHPELQKLITYDFPEKRALLIEKDPMLQKAHYVLISNLGYHVDVASSKEEVITHTQNHYDVVFTRPYQKDLNGMLTTKLFLLDKPRSKIYIYITPEESDMKIYFTKQGADAVLELPLSMYTLFDALK